MTSDDPSNRVIVSAIVFALSERHKPLTRAQQAIVSGDKYMLPFYTGNNDLTPDPDLTPTHEPKFPDLHQTIAQT